jgi:predicted dehydrogenase
MNKPAVAVAGCGYWGQHLIRNLNDLPDIELCAVCDLDLPALARVKRRYPNLEVFSNYQEIVANPRIDAVVIATPVSTHYGYARRALEAGKHVLVETPMATSAAEASDLLKIAEKKQRVLMVDHTFLYTAAVREMKALIDRGDAGTLLYIDSVRISLGVVQNDVNVLWDLGPHDLSIVHHLCGRMPSSVSAVGLKHLNCPFENMAYVSLRFDNDLIAHFHLNWLAPVKVRRILVGGSSKMIVYDDMEATEKIRIYDKGFSITHDPAHRNRLLAGYRNGDMRVPNLDTQEALQLVVADFSSAMVKKTQPLSGGACGYFVVRLLELAQISMSQNGRPVEAPWQAVSRASAAHENAGAVAGQGMPVNNHAASASFGHNGSRAIAGSR